MTEHEQLAMLFEGVAWVCGAAGAGILVWSAWRIWRRP